MISPAQFTHVQEGEGEEADTGDGPVIGEGDHDAWSGGFFFGGGGLEEEKVRVRRENVGVRCKALMWTSDDALYLPFSGRRPWLWDGRRRPLAGHPAHHVGLSLLESLLFIVVERSKMVH